MIPNKKPVSQAAIPKHEPVSQAAQASTGIKRMVKKSNTAAWRQDAAIQATLQALEKIAEQQEDALIETERARDSLQRTLAEFCLDEND